MKRRAVIKAVWVVLVAMVAFSMALWTVAPAL